jgi:hypothetical protein
LGLVLVGTHTSDQRGARACRGTNLNIKIYFPDGKGCEQGAKGQKKVEGTAGLTCINGKTVSPVKYVVNKSASSFTWTSFNNVSHVLFGEDVKPGIRQNFKAVTGT